MQTRGRWQTSTVNEDNTTKTVMVATGHLRYKHFPYFIKLVVLLTIFIFYLISGMNFGQSDHFQKTASSIANVYLF
jgi:hypothetical protein